MQSLQQYASSSDDDDDQTPAQATTGVVTRHRGTLTAHIFIKAEVPAALVSAATAELLADGWHAVDDLHISLSKTLVIPTFQKDALLRLLQTEIRGILKFDVRLGGQELVRFVNDTRTRTFAALPVGRGMSSLNRLILKINRRLVELRLPEFYERPEFHVSCVWRDGDVPLVRAPQAPLMSIVVRRIDCRIGTSFHHFNLQQT